MYSVYISRGGSCGAPRVARRQGRGARGASATHAVKAKVEGDSGSTRVAHRHMRDTNAPHSGAECEGSTVARDLDVVACSWCWRRRNWLHGG